jgi:VanZ family protein
MEWLRRWWPALVWALCISTFSTRTFTADNTASVLIPVLHWLMPKASMDFLLLLHHLIRKAAHVTEYFLLSLLVLRGIRAGRPTTRLGWALAAIGIVAGYAALDEFHQAFVPGRTAAVSDILLDTTGGIAAQCVAALVLLLGNARERERES